MDEKARIGPRDEGRRAMDGSDHDRLIRLTAKVEQLERQIEEYREGARALAMSETRGYVDGQVRSIVDGIEVTRGALQSEIGDLRVMLRGKNGDNGLNHRVKLLTWIVKSQWALLIIAYLKVFGVKLPGIF